MTQATWTSPISNKVLLEAGFSRFQYLWAGFGQAPPDALTGLIPVTESQAIDNHRANFTYRGMFDPLGFGWADNDANPNNWRASMSYVTGAHNLKFGYQGSYQRSLQARDANTTLLRYTMNNRVLNGVGLHPRVEVGAERSHRDSALLRAGSVDEGALHAAGRAALRPRVELGAGRGQRHDGDLADSTPRRSPSRAP